MKTLIHKACAVVFVFLQANLFLMTNAFGQVIVTDSKTCISPAISTQPSNLSAVRKGSSQTFLVDAAGTEPLSYQWYKSGNPVAEVGTNSNSYTISSVAATDAGYYYVVVKNDCGSVTSKVISLTLEPTPKNSTVSCLSSAVTPADVPFAIDACDGTITGVLSSIIDTPDLLVCEGTRVYTYSYTNRSGKSAYWKYTYTIKYSGELKAPTNTSSTVSKLAEAVDPGPPPDITDDCGRKVSAVLVGSSTPLTPVNSVVWTYRYTAVDCTTTADWTHTYTIDNLGGLAASENTASTLPACTMIIPNGFSPNGDGINDYFHITCLEKYPDAKLMIYSDTPALLYEQEHYGNFDFWGSEDAAWWNGADRDKHKLASGTYIYILDLEYGRKHPVKTGYVFINR
jgi:gliding motility-associated-like protein